MQTQRKYAAALLFATLVVSGLAGCNTIRGIGKDTERAGEKIQKESDRHHRGHHDDDGSGASAQPT